MVFTSIREILAGRDFAWVAPQATLEAASDLMMTERVAALPVLVDRDLAGIITERDILQHASQVGGFVTTPVARVMTREVVCVETRSSVVHALIRMQEGGFRHLPVLDLGSKVVGMLRRDDIPVEFEIMRARYVAWRGTALAG